jgi:hypothetical protein
VNDAKPATLQDYMRWLRDTHNVDAASPAMRDQFDSVVSRIKLSFESSPFWTELTTSLPDHNDTYLIRTGYRLFTNPEPPDILTKCFDSFLAKTFRRNVLDNANWRSEPPEGWLLPQNWYSKISDLVRTCLIVKYLDGVRFTIDAITALSEAHNLQSAVSYEAREEGYYAAHILIHSTADVPQEKWDSQRIPVTLEIQVTTQLQDVIRKLLHRYYEQRRTRTADPETKWQWDYESDEFLTNYLGHLLHYAEGMIMAARSRQAASSTTQLHKERVS